MATGLGRNSKDHKAIKTQLESIVKEQDANQLNKTHQTAPYTLIDSAADTSYISEETLIHRTMGELLTTTQQDMTISSGDTHTQVSSESLNIIADGQLSMTNSKENITLSAHTGKLEATAKQDVNIASIAKNYDYQPKISFTNNPANGKPTTINNRHHVPLYKKDSQGNYLVDSNGNLIQNNTLGLRDDLIDLYAKQQNTIFDDDDDNKQTYILLTDFYISDIGLDNQGEFDKTTLGGVTSGEVKTSGSSNHTKKWIEWGNFVLMFDDENENYDVISTVHELGHSFSLPHTFEIDDYTKHSFYKGYTDNIMDYSHKDVDPLFTNTISDLNTYDGQQFSLFKWQWEILRNDRSIKK